MLAAAGVWYFGIAALFVFAGNLNQDEGWYLQASRVVYQGAIPYRDFPFFQCPLSPYLYGAAQALFGPSLLTGRFTAAAFGGVTAALVAWIATRLAGKSAGAVGLVMLAVSPSYMLGATTARSEAPTVAFTVLALALLLSAPTGFRGVVGGPAALLLASAVRLTFAPAFVLVLIYAIWRAKPSPRELVLALTALALLAGALFGVFIVADPHAMVHNVWTSQLNRNSQITPEGSTPPSVWLFTLTTSFSAVISQFQYVLVPSVLAVAYAAQRYRGGWRPSRPAFGADPLSNYALIIALATVVWVPAVKFNVQEPRYFLPAFALLAVLVADLTVRASGASFGEAGSTILRPAIVAFFVLAIAFNASNAYVDLNLRHPDLPDQNRAGEYIRGLAGPNGQIVVLNPTLAVASGTVLPAPLTMGYFSFWPLLPADEVSRYKLVDLSRLQDLMLAPETKVVALDDWDLRAISLAPDVKQDPKALAYVFKVLPSLSGRYTLIRTFPHAGILRSNLYVLQRIY